VPFKSRKQRRKFGAMVNEGKISKAVFDEWQRDTPKNIPDKVKRKKRR
jgi:hypothetical protein